MLTHHHLLIAFTAVLMAELAASPESSGNAFILATLAGMVSSLMDLDALVLVYAKSKGDERLRRFRNPLEIYREYDLFLKTASELGLFRYTSVTHISVSLIILSLSYLFFRWFFVPAILGVISHLISDIPEFYRGLRKTDE